VQPGVKWLVMDVARAFKPIGTCADLTGVHECDHLAEPGKTKITLVLRGKGHQAGRFALIVVPSIESK